MPQTKNRASGIRPRHDSTHNLYERLEPDWQSGATVENTALATVALEEARPNRLIEATYALSVSPMSRVLAANCRTADSGGVVELRDSRR